MKKLLVFLLLALPLMAFNGEGCNADSSYKNATAGKEQAATEDNQAALLTKQPPPKLTWSLERDNLTKRFKLQNDRTVSFYMYLFIEGVATPIGYYMVNKVSSVNSQLTNTEQMIYLGNYSAVTLPSPAEDGSYGTNGDGVFGFTPEDVYIEHDLHYIVATVPLTFPQPVQQLAIINTEDARQMLARSRKAMTQ